MSPLVSLRRRQGPSRPRRVTRRTLSVGVGSVLAGALVLGTATSSAHGGALTATQVEAEPVSVAQVLPGDSVALLGFAPPPTRESTRLPAPQFRLAGDLPTGPLGIPGVVLQAYKLAANRIGAESAQCKLPWFLLAGIGRIESNHASNGSVDEFGTTINPIAGPILNGTLAGNEVITDTDGGRIDGDAGHDRAMGPMQFIPSTWAAWGSDANGDGKADPNNIFDATYSAGRYLCAGVTDIMAERNKVAAVLRYNRSMEYVANVLSWAGAYATGVQPTNPIPEPKRPKSASSSKKPSKPRPGERPTDPSAGTSPSKPPTSTPPPPGQPCFVICLPSIPLPGAPAPAPTKKKPAPEPTKPRGAAPAPGR